MDTDTVFEENKGRQSCFQVLTPTFLFLFCKTRLS